MKSINQFTIYHISHAHVLFIFTTRCLDAKLRISRYSLGGFQWDLRSSTAFSKLSRGKKQPCHTKETVTQTSEMSQSIVMSHLLTVYCALR